ncbi:MAG: LysR family transcriptional regulator [Alphaproteobacteria bacterium]|nr:LysR family transcriptional regulator [Alphaproteobacteria bacterium]MBU0795435.1 LysR family transcriptional regulator [Alphaproteobacteria bacterium]MBU0876610.1 LysR family transcriptional regulator [Alphaproteobacteria bacterium]MBU1769311.1 LysR family transcriptional regulator [Alphaproteobacteria bacterium]
MLHARLLRYIDEVARRGSIRKAASHLNVASTAINRQIIAYEEEIGTQIFERLPRQVRPTAAGEILLRHIRATLKEHDRARAEIAALQGLQSGSVTIATFENLAANLLPQVSRSFRRIHPRIQVQVFSVFRRQLQAGLATGEWDLALGYNISDVPGSTVLYQFETRLGAVVSTQHPLASRSEVRLSDCALHPIIVGNETMTIYGIMHDAFAQANVPFRPQVASNSVAFMKSLARQAEGVTFMTKVDIAEEIGRGELVYIPIRDKGVRTQPLSLIYRKNATLGSAVSRLAEQIRIELELTL